MSRHSARSWLALAVLVAAAATAPMNADASDGFGVYLYPYAGYSWLKLKSLEIDEAFIAPPEGEIEIPVDPNFGDARRSVGRQSNFRGGGFTLGGSAGIRIFSLGLGVHYSWTPVEVEGYAKHYHYFPDLARAGGRKFLDRGVLDTQRVLFEVQYRLPIWRFEIAIRTRIGSVFIDDNGLAVGRKLDTGGGFTGDLGASIVFNVVKPLSIGIDGWFGFFSFDGAYEGVYGSCGGLGLIVALEI